MTKTNWEKLMNDIENTNLGIKDWTIIDMKNICYSKLITIFGKDSTLQTMVSNYWTKKDLPGEEATAFIAVILYINRHYININLHLILKYIFSIPSKIF